MVHKCLIIYATAEAPTGKDLPLEIYTIVLALASIFTFCADRYSMTPLFAPRDGLLDNHGLQVLTLGAFLLDFSYDWREVFVIL